MKISLFLPIIIQHTAEVQPSLKERLLNAVERYFILNSSPGYTIHIARETDGRISSKIECDTIITSGSSFPRFLAVLKIISYVTLIIPAMMFLAKFILRSLNHVDKIKIAPTVPKKPVEKHEPFPHEDNELHVPSDKHPWIFSQMPVAPQKTISSEDFDALNDNDLKISLETLCDDLEKGNCPSHITPSGESDEYIFFENQNYPGVKFIGVRDNFYTPLNKNSQNYHPNNPKELIQEWYDKNLEIQQLVESDQSAYSRLCLPKFKMFKISGPQGDQFFIVQQRMIRYRTNASCLVWKNQDKNLRLAFQQLASLVIKTGMREIHSDCLIPIAGHKNTIDSLCLVHVLKRSPSDTPPEKAPKGLLALINNLYSQESMEAILEKAQPEHQKELKTAIEKRAQLLSFMRHHEQFHLKQRTACYGKRPAPTEISEKFLNSLGLDLDEETDLDNDNKPTISMREAISSLMDYWNHLKSQTGWHEIILSHCFFHNPLKMDNFIPKGLEKACSRGDSFTDPSKLWIRKILNALVQKEIMCSWNVSPYEPFDNWKSVLILWI